MVVILAISAAIVGITFGVFVSSKCDTDAKDDSYSVWISFLVVVLVVVIYYILRSIFL